MIDTILNITIVLLIIIFLILIRTNNYENNEKEFGYTNYKLKKQNIECKKSIPILVDYNHVKQRSIRRDIDFIQSEIYDKRKNIEKKAIKKHIERNNEIELEKETETINSIDKEIIKLILEYRMIKKGILVINTTEEKHKHLQNIINKLKNKKQLFENIEIKTKLLNEYIKLLQNAKLT